ncbi:reverse transcriptase domain-containing protein [Tanacetum coccineum]
MKEEFPGWFGSQICQRHIDKDLGVSASSDLFALACGPTPPPISVNSCMVNGVRNNMTQIWANGESFKNDQYIIATQVKQVFYLEDMARRPPNWMVVEDMNHKKFLNEGVVVAEDDYEVIHFDNSSDLALSTSLNDLDFVTLHIDGQSMDVDAPPDIIDVDEDDDIIDDKDALPYDLAYSDDEDLVNVDDDDDMSADVARGHGGDGGGDDRPPPHQIGGGCRDRPGVPDALPFLAQHPGGAEGGGPGKDWVKDWDAQIAFWSDPKNVARCAQNARNRAKSTVICRQGSRSLVVLRDRQSSATREYPSLIQAYFDTHTVDGVFLRDEERLLYEEMLRLQGLGTYTDDQIMAIVHQGKQRGHIPGVGRVLAGRGMYVLISPEPRCTHTADVDELKRTNKQLKKQMDMIMKVVRSDDKMSQLLTQLQSQHEVGSGSGSGGGGDDEPGDDEDTSEEEEDEDS